MNNDSISHQGVVESVLSDKITVRIMSVSACSTCHASGVCNASDQQEKIIEALPNGKPIKPGDWVTVTAKESMGFKALFLGYLLPFLLVMAALIITTSLSFKEIWAGLISLGVLVPYYAVLYFRRERINKSFVFEIQR